MIKSFLQRIIGTSTKRIYVVLGEQFSSFKEPSYSTHPDTYSFPFDRTRFLPVSPNVFPSDPFELPIGKERESGPNVIKVFSRAKDAINFVYCCNLNSASTLVYELIQEEWVPAEDQSAFDIDW
jgi:hypothetical protein